MHLSYFGLITLDGSVNKPEPGLDFASYQVAMAHYSATIALRARLRSKSLAPLSEETVASNQQPAATTDPAFPQHPPLAGMPPSSGVPFRKPL